jgi:membrane fusion protein, type I secretion system
MEKKIEKAKKLSSRPFPLLPASIGVVLCAGFTAALTVWLGSVPLSSAIVAPGVVSVESSRKSVQHLEGGIVGRILVRDGASVKRGDVVVELRNVAASAAVDRLKTQHFEALANLARLIAERDGLESISFPDTLSEAKDDLLAVAAMAGQQKVFQSRRKLQEEKLSVIEKKIAQVGEERAGLVGQVDAASQQMGLLAEERQDLERLYKRKLLRKSRYLKLKRRQAEVGGRIAKLKAAVSEAEQEILELKLKKSELRASRTAAVVDELRIQQAEAYELSRELAAAHDVLARTLIRSPIDGTIVNLKVHSQGGVIGAGQTLMEVVPVSDDLIVEARVRPKDIGAVRAGLQAHVVLATLSRRHSRPIAGVLQSVSADRLVDQISGNPFYRVRVSLDKASVKIQDNRLLAGMGADVFIQTGTRTPLEYLTAPILKSIARGMREN